MKLKNININRSSAKSWLELSLINKLGPKTILKLLEHFQSVDNIFMQNASVLEKYTNKIVAQSICSRASALNVDIALKWQQNGQNRHIISIEDEIYPKELIEISDPPIVLYLEGDINLLRNNKIAMVGTRHPTTQGTENAMHFARDLSNNRFTVVSGVAAGIDRCAHLGSLSGASSTI